MVLFSEECSTKTAIGAASYMPQSFVIVGLRRRGVNVAAIFADHTDWFEGDAIPCHSVNIPSVLQSDYLLRRSFNSLPARKNGVRLGPTVTIAPVLGFLPV